VPISSRFLCMNGTYMPRTLAPVRNDQVAGSNPTRSFTPGAGELHTKTKKF